VQPQDVDALWITQMPVTFVRWLPCFAPFVGNHRFYTIKSAAPVTRSFAWLMRDAMASVRCAEMSKMVAAMSEMRVLFSPLHKWCP